MPERIVPRYESREGYVYEEWFAPDRFRLNWVRMSGIPGLIIGPALFLTGLLASAADTPKNGYAGLGKPTDHLLVAIGIVLAAGSILMAFAASSLQGWLRRRDGIICSCAEGGGEQHFHLDESAQAKVAEHLADYDDETE